MALTPPRAAARASLLVGFLALAGTQALAQPVQGPAAVVEAPRATIVWIFSGQLPDSRETFSGTLVRADGVEFEMKMGNEATCDASLAADAGELIRLPEITCTDERTMRALFAPDGEGALRVFGQVGQERFLADAHLLATDSGATGAPR